MDDFQRLQQRAYIYLVLINVLTLSSGVAVWAIADSYALPATTAFGAACLVMMLLFLATSFLASRHLLQPLKVLWQAILHVSPEAVNVPRPNIDKLRFGRELVLSLTNRVYQFASQGEGEEVDRRKALLQAVNIVNLFPQPLFVFNKDRVVTNASASALEYLGLESTQLFGQKLFEHVDLEFATPHTLERWIEDCQANKVTDYAFWRRVRINLPDGKTVKQCDLAAHYNRANASGTEFIITLVDQTENYHQDDESLSFIAMAVHELRTPLTMLRGYVEVFEEELDGKLDAELASYLRKLRLSTDQLSAFVSTILSVVKVDENQLSFKLAEADWPKTLRQSADHINARAQILGKTITFKIDGDLPTVAVDPTSITEVINNLLDNALKYSGDSTDIIVSSRLNAEGFIETTVQDFGVGIPANVIPNLFERFYRNHRTRNQFGGTGLGLYLSKAIINAHGGTIAVKSKPGEGSSFTFTLKPYASLADEQKNSDNDGITRHAHGWIKNHSMYRR